MRIPLFLRLSLITMLAFIVNIFVYFSFGNIYSSTLFNHENFVEQYTNGIYQYRFLSTEVFLWLHNIIINLPFDIPLKGYFWNSSGENEMLLSYYMINTFFLCLCAILLGWIMDFKIINTNHTDKIMVPILGIFTIIFTQYIVVPYDISSYFFILLFISLTIKYLETQSKKYFIGLILVMILATLNRESSALSLSFIATIVISKLGINKRSLFPVAILTSVFIVVYFAMRLYYGSFSTNDGNLILVNFTQIRNYIGMLFWLVFFLLSLALCVSKNNIKLIILFHVFAIPYIIMCFYTGILYETRLYIPIFISCLILGKLNFNQNTITELNK